MLSRIEMTYRPQPAGPPNCPARLADARPGRGALRDRGRRRRPVCARRRLLACRSKSRSPRATGTVATTARRYRSTAPKCRPSQRVPGGIEVRVWNPSDEPATPRSPTASAGSWISAAVRCARSKARPRSDRGKFSPSACHTCPLETHWGPFSLLALVVVGLRAAFSSSKEIDDRDNCRRDRRRPTVPTSPRRRHATATTATTGPGGHPADDRAPRRSRRRSRARQPHQARD